MKQRVVVKPDFLKRIKRQRDKNEKDYIKEGYNNGSNPIRDKSQKHI